MPQIVITRKVKIALLVLRLYLVTMLVLIAIGFVRRATKHKDAPPAANANAAAATAPAAEPTTAPTTQPATAPARAEAEPPR
jgi:hypothetical protein